MNKLIGLVVMALMMIPTAAIAHDVDSDHGNCGLYFSNEDNQWDFTGLSFGTYCTGHTSGAQYTTRDDFDGQGGNDIAYWYDGADEFTMGIGADSAYGGSGNDVMLGNDGNDTISMGLGGDDVQGGPGGDTITSTDTGDGEEVCDGDHFDTVDLRDGDNLDVLYAASDGVSNENFYLNSGDVIIYLSGSLSCDLPDHA